MASPRQEAKKTPKKEEQRVDTCFHCQSIICKRFIDKHLLSCSADNPMDRMAMYGCPYGLLREQNLHCQPSVAKEPPEAKKLPTWLRNHLLLLSEQTMRLCRLALGDYVVLSDKNGGKVAAVVWPSDEVPSLEAAISERFETDLAGGLKLEKAQVALAGRLLLLSQDWRQLYESDAFWQYCKTFLLAAVFADGELVKIPYFGIDCYFKTLVDNSDHLPSSMEALHISQPPRDPLSKLYSLSPDTVVSVRHAEHRDTEVFSFANIYGLHQSKADLNRYLIRPMQLLSNGQIAVRELQIRTVLLYGPEGCGKSSLAQAVAKEIQANLVVLSLDALREYNLAVDGRTVILIDDLDRSAKAVCTEAVIRVLDSVRRCPVAVVAICVCQNLHELCPKLRSRFDAEVEVGVPNVVERQEILTGMLSQCPYVVEKESLVNVAKITHGFTPSDLQQVIKEAICSLHSLWYETKDASRILDHSLLMEASTKVSPSAMREIVLEIPEVRWADIGGEDELKRKLKEMVEWPLRYPEAFKRLGVRPAGGILMYGPPGCSKTMIARAMATESQLNFIAIKGPELFSKYVGESEKAVRDVFRKARQVAPAVIFFDEIDALASQRSSDRQGVGNRVLAQLLTEMDGIEPLHQVIIMAATNRPDMIDGALLRPGRLDRIVYVPLPDAKTRRDIFQIRLNNMPTDAGVDVNALVIKSDGYSGAEISAVCNEAAMLAMEENVNCHVVCWRHFEGAFQLVTPRTSAELLSIYEAFQRQQ